MLEAPKRPYKQRAIEGFDRSRVRQEVLATRGRQFSQLRKRYATLVLGASLAVGGLGIPLNVARIAEAATHKESNVEERGSVTAPPTGFESPGEESVSESQEAPEATESPTQQLTLITEKARERFFNAQVPFGSIIYKEAKKNEISPELLAAVVKAESQFKPTARSHRGAQGLMQLVPRTGRWMGAKNLMNPNDNVQAGAKYLKYLSERFDGDQRKMIAAYNAGEGNVRRFGGVPPFRETQNYVEKVLGHQSDFEDQVSGKVAEGLETVLTAPLDLADAP